MSKGLDLNEADRGEVVAMALSDHVSFADTRRE